MSEKPPKKSTKGRKAMGADAKKTTIRASIPALQAQAARDASSSLGMEFGEFVEWALKEAIYQAVLTKNIRTDNSNALHLASLPPYPKEPAKKQAR